MCSVNLTQSQNIALFNQLLADFATLQQSLSNPINHLSPVLWARSVALSWKLLEVSESMEQQAKSANFLGNKKAE